MRMCIPSRMMLGAILTTSLLSIGCGGEEEPPPPSTPPELSAPQVTCGDATSEMAAKYDVDYPVILEVSVQATDAERDLVLVTGNVNGYPITELTDDDADLRFTWSPPNSLEPMVCRGEIVLSFQATDNDDNVSDLAEIIEK